MINTDWSDPAFNSYATLAELDALAAEAQSVRSTDKWTALDDPSKEAYAIQATVWMSQFAYCGSLEATVASPKACWPRTGTAYLNGLPVDDTEVPQAIKQSQFIRCLDALDGLGVSHTSGTTAAGQIKKEVLDSLQTEYFESSGSNSFDAQTKRTSAYRSLEWAICDSSNSLRRT